MIHRQRIHRDDPVQAVDPAVGPAPTGAGPGAPAIPPSSTIHIAHGIHGGDFPFVGMTVRQARLRMAPLYNIDPAAVAVIRGEVVADEESRVLSAADALVSFVKESSVKGADGSRAGGRGR